MMYTDEQIARMEKGRAPQRYNEETRSWVSKELHKVSDPRNSNHFDVVEVWADEPVFNDPFRHFGEMNAKL